MKVTITAEPTEPIHVLRIAFSSLDVEEAVSPAALVADIQERVWSAMREFLKANADGR